MGEAKRKRAARKPAEAQKSTLITVALTLNADLYMSMYFVPHEQNPPLPVLVDGFLEHVEKIIQRRLPLPAVLVTTLDDGDEAILKVLRRILTAEQWADVDTMRHKSPCFTAIFGHVHDPELMAIH